MKAWRRRSPHWLSRGQESLIRTSGGNWFYYETSIAEGIFAGDSLKGALKFASRRERIADERRGR